VSEAGRKKDWGGQLQNERPAVKEDGKGMPKNSNSLQKPEYSGDQERHKKRPRDASGSRFRVVGRKKKNTSARKLRPSSRAAENPNQKQGPKRRPTCDAISSKNRGRGRRAVSPGPGGSWVGGQTIRPTLPPREKKGGTRFWPDARQGLQEKYLLGGKKGTGLVGGREKARG